MRESIEDVNEGEERHAHVLIYTFFFEARSSFKCSSIVLELPDLHAQTALYYMCVRRRSARFFPVQFRTERQTGVRYLCVRQSIVQTLTDFFSLSSVHMAGNRKK